MRRRILWNRTGSSGGARRARSVHPPEHHQREQQALMDAVSVLVVPTATEHTCILNPVATHKKQRHKVAVFYINPVFISSPT